MGVMILLCLVVISFFTENLIELLHKLLNFVRNIDHIEVEGMILAFKKNKTLMIKSKTLESIFIIQEGFG